MIVGGLGHSVIGGAVAALGKLFQRRTGLYMSAILLPVFLLGVALGLVSLGVLSLLVYKIFGRSFYKNAFEKRKESSDSLHFTKNPEEPPRIGNHS